MKKLLLFTGFLAVFSLTSACVKPQTQENYKPYTDAVFNFSLSVPQSWNRAQFEPLVTFFQAPEKDEFNASLGILTDAYNPKTVNMTQKEFYEESIKAIQDFKIISYKKTVFAGQECLEVVFDSAGSYGKMRQKEYIFNYNNVLFILIFTSLQKYYAQYETDFQKIADSFYFIDGSNNA